MHRAAAYIVHISLVDKPVPIHKLWKLRSDKEVEPTKIVMTKELRDMIISSHGLKNKVPQ